MILHCINALVFRGMWLHNFTRTEVLSEMGCQDSQGQICDVSLHCLETDAFCGTWLHALTRCVIWAWGVLCGAQLGLHVHLLPALGHVITFWAIRLVSFHPDA